MRRPRSVAAADGAAGPTMRAAVLPAYGEPLELREVPVPELVAGEALLRVEAVGLCATDLKVISGALAGSSQAPMVPGHEIAGTVERCPGRPELEGRRAGVYIYDACGRCRWCAAGEPTLCPHAVRPGVERDGGLADFVAVPQENLVTVDDGIDIAAVAVAMDAVLAPWGALHRRARIQAGERLAVIGCGGLGAHAVQIARAAGARVAVVDPVESHRELGLSSGAERAVAPGELDAVRTWADGGCDLALETSGVRAGFDAAASVVRAGGRVVCNGYQPGTEYGLDSARLVLAEITVMGSRLSTRADARAALDAVQRGDVRPQIMETVPLERINEALGRLAAGAVEGRLVVGTGQRGQS